MANIPQSFQKLYDYIESRKAVDVAQTEQIENIDEKVDNLDKKIDDNTVNFDVIYDLLSISKGTQGS